jgi:hypothetical protein
MAFGGIIFINYWFWSGWIYLIYILCIPKKFQKAKLRWVLKYAALFKHVKDTIKIEPKAPVLKLNIDSSTPESLKDGDEKKELTPTNNGKKV